MTKKILVYMNDRVSERINVIQESVGIHNKSAFIERVMSNIIFDDEKIKFIFPEFKGTKKIEEAKMEEININDEDFTKKVDVEKAILISYDINWFDIGKAKEYILKERGFGWGTPINLNLNKCPRYFYCYIHEKKSKPPIVTHVAIVDKSSSRSSKIEKIWKELERFRKENKPNKLVLFLRSIKDDNIPIKNFKKLNGDKIDLAALRNFVWVKPLV